jgi:phage shock protein PspC (stress-responsive transcriptional regulator)
MNKTVSINIAGLVFNIEEKAYELLKNYLLQIRNKFENEDEQDEILEDIEARIAELCNERLSSTKQVITKLDIEEIMEILGKPEDYIEEDEDNVSPNQRTQFKSKSKRLFRDPDNSTVAGVCGGLGHYFGVDPVLFRILFVLLVIMGGSGILFYLILIFAVPEAKTTSEKLEMRGEPVNVDSIKAHFNDIKDKFTDNERTKNFQKTIKKSANNVSVAGRGLVNFLSTIVGIFFTIFALFTLTILTLIYFGNTNLLPFFEGQHIDGIFTLIDSVSTGPSQTLIIYSTLFIASILPLIGMLTIGVKLLFKISVMNKPLSRGGLILWGLSLVTLFFCGTQIAIQFKSHTSLEQSFEVNADSTDVFNVSILDDPHFSPYINMNKVWDASELIKIDQDSIYLGAAELIIRQHSNDSDYKVVVLKESNGKTMNSAVTRAENYKYQIQLKGNNLSVSPYYSIPKEDKIRLQHPTVEIYVPIGKKIKFGKNINRMIISFPGTHKYYDTSFENSIWFSSADGFIPLAKELN